MLQLIPFCFDFNLKLVMFENPKFGGQNLTKIIGAEIDFLFVSGCYFDIKISRFFNRVPESCQFLCGLFI